MGWAPVTDPNELAAAQAQLTGKGGGKFTNPDKNALNTWGDQSNEASLMTRDYRRLFQLLPKINPDHAPIMDSVTPKEGGGIGNYLMSKITSNGERAGITPQERAAYKEAMAIKNRYIQQAQLLQKGPQTESDARRIGLTTFDMSNPLSTNVPILMRGYADAATAARKSSFYTKWANKYGLNGVDKAGRSADQAWMSARGKVNGLEARQTPKLVSGMSGGNVGGGSNDGWKVEKVGD